MSKIKIGEKIGRPQNIYRLAIEFMWGDADGEKIVKVDIPEEEIDSENFQSLLKDLSKMLKLDRQGREGIEDSDELWEHYKKVGVDIRKYFEIYTEEEIEEKDMLYGIEYPSDGQSGYYYSVRGLTITYFDKDGIEYLTNFDK